MMKKSLLYVFVMTLMVVASCDKKKQNKETDETTKDSTKVEKKDEPKEPKVYPGFDNSYAGTLGKDQAIKMNLRRYDDQLSGTYWMVADGKDVLLNGTLKEGTFELNEIDKEGNLGAKITGKLEDQNAKVTGEWTKEGKTQKFELTLAKRLKPSPWKLDQKEVDEHSKVGSCYIHVSYPQFKGMSDVKMQTKVNNLIEKHFPIHEMEASLLDCKDSFKDDVNYGVSYLRGSLISITKTHHLTRAGKPHPGESWGINLNFYTGKVYELRDFFKPDMIGELNKFLQEKVNENCGGTLTEEQLARIELKPTNKEGFSLTDNRSFKGKITREGKVIFHLTDRVPSKLRSSGYVKVYYHALKKFINPYGPLMSVLDRYERQTSK
ncbi:hypothetical protein [uncultured Microscilla sp.]|uniref:hypothetical protein n=1 Tax=uncultured Microscilla sp. TaxID=432653 RepID=UPI0026075636|nr:hypothetical protein [uncultured Microscilla sp.]